MKPSPHPESFLPLRPVEFHVLLSLGAGERHGYGIMREAAERTGEEVIPDVGTLYRALRRMAASGLIEQAPAREEEDGEDARRIYYRITEHGRAVAVAEARRLSVLVAAARAGGYLAGEG